MQIRRCVGSKACILHPRGKHGIHTALSKAERVDLKSGSSRNINIIVLLFLPSLVPSPNNNDMMDDY